MVAELLLLGALLPGLSSDEKAKRLDAIEVVGRRTDVIGSAMSASEGVVTREEIAARPMLRGGDLIEFVPGMVATQHSGSGKANQYFLRGFNLDHGTDFATFVDGMPVNLRSHGHGQGYTDLNFLIPELVQTLTYRKGVQHVDVGDFSSAGSVRLALADRLDASSLQLGLGEYGYARGLLLGDLALASGNLVLALERQTQDGAWDDVDEDVGKRNAVLRWSVEGSDSRGHLMLMHYRNAWNSADQIPRRAVAQGLIGRLGSLDRTLGGDTRRDSLSAGWQGALAGGELQARAYAIDYDFQLWSNFTYFLDDPENGDQFRQFDQRRYYGGDLIQSWQRGDGRWQLGLDARRDSIDAVGLARSRQRQPLADIRRDAVAQSSLGLFAAYEHTWSEQLRGSLGLRSDRHRFRVDSDLGANSGRRRASAVSPKASLAWTPRPDLALYASAGEGLHSNDARGTTIRFDPISGEPVDAVDPLVESRGGELGARWHLADRWQASAALWRLDLDSELLFVGDAGTTEATRASRRDGLELGLYWIGGERWAADLELAWTDARFRDRDPAGSEIPGAVPFVASFSLRHEGPGGWFSQARWRHFGRYPLIEDGGVRSAGSDIVHLGLGKRLGRWTASLDLLNLLDSRDSDIEYFYASRLPGEPEDGVEDIHFHGFEPRTLRLGLSYRFD